jgi:hypothetical protein
MAKTLVGKTFVRNNRVPKNKRHTMSRFKPGSDRFTIDSAEMTSSGEMLYFTESPRCCFSYSFLRRWYREV